MYASEQLGMSGAETHPLLRMAQTVVRPKSAKVPRCSLLLTDTPRPRLGRLAHDSRRRDRCMRGTVVLSTGLWDRLEESEDSHVEIIPGTGLPVAQVGQTLTDIEAVVGPAPS